MAAAKNSITESSPNPTRAMDEAITPAVIATAASAVIQAMLAYSSQNPRWRSRATRSAPAALGVGTTCALLTAGDVPIVPNLGSGQGPPSRTTSSTTHHCGFGNHEEDSRSPGTAMDS